MKKILVLTLSLLLVLAGSCLAATYYLSPTGDDEDNGGVGDPWKTFAHAFGEMSAGDTLILNDGTYSVAAGTGIIGGSTVPPNGTSTSAMTTVQAVNIGLAIIDGGMSRAVTLGASSAVEYVKISGVKLIGGASLPNADYCYLKNCGSRGAILIGSSDSNSSDYNLVEDCWIWTDDERTLASSYDSQYNIFRRVVMRADGYSIAQYSPGVTFYNSQYCLAQNVIIIDRVVGNTTYTYGDFATAMHAHDGENSYTCVGHEWNGCISVGSNDNGFHMEADTKSAPSHTLKNCLVLHDNDLAYVVTGINIVGTSPLLDGITLIQKQTWSYEGMNLQNSSSATARNVIIYGNGDRYAAAYISTPSYFDVSGTFTLGTYNSVTCSTGCLTSDPTNDGSPVSMLYPVRIEDGSALNGTGYDSKDYGATILKKHGTTGAFYGESGYNTPTSDDLWPWPNEDLIKSQMSEEYTSTVEEARGFCNGTSEDGSSQTLTKYIWEYLGNEIPAEIYGSETPAATRHCSGAFSGG